MDYFYIEVCQICPMSSEAKSVQPCTQHTHTHEYTVVMMVSPVLFQTAEGGATSQSTAV